ncbi:MAG: hypothetical protein RL329_1602 [Bacteroidota bacterium]|jgi:membrane glycosyltransferase
MPYSQFNTLHAVRKQLGLRTKFRNLFTNFEEIAPSDWLVETLMRHTKRRTAFFNEKSRSEAIVFPILSELQNRHQFRIKVGEVATLSITHRIKKGA